LAATTLAPVVPARNTRNATAPAHDPINLHLCQSI
jgi:hypothetical protein